MTSTERPLRPSSFSSRGRLMSLGMTIVMVFGFAGDARAQPWLDDFLLSWMGGKSLSAQSLADMEAPGTPNPYLAFLPPDAEVDWAYWDTLARLTAQERGLAAKSALTATLSFTESEPNDSATIANPITGVGTAPGKSPAIDVGGNFVLPEPATLAPLPEDEGSIPLATPSGLTSGHAVRFEGVLGDGPFGSTSGDLDFYSIPGVRTGQAILVDVRRLGSDRRLNSFITLWSSTGVLQTLNVDDDNTPDGFLTFTARADDDYYVAVAGVGTFLPANPFDSSTGVGPPLGPNSDGPYEIILGLDVFDTDFFSVDLRRGDVFSTNLRGTANSITLIDPEGTMRVGSRQDRSFVYPEGASPISGGGNASSAYVIEEGGTWTVKIDGSLTGPYTAELRLFRSGFESGTSGDVQKIFLDFDGATIDIGAVFSGPPDQRAFAPLASFLANWGLSAADEDAVIDAVVATVVENLSQDLRVKGNNGDFNNSDIPGEFDVEILNSRDHADTFGIDPNVSRVIIGGSSSETGVNTIGLAQSVDPGNYARAETATLQLDVLSAPAGHPSSLNTLERAPGVSIISLIATALGNITAHEIGHYVGNFHTENTFGPVNLMDQGGNLPGFVGIGPDGVFGTADDADVDFIRDDYVANEGFFGLEDSVNTTAFACSTPTSDSVVIAGCDSGAPNLFLFDDTTINENLGDCIVVSNDEDDFEDCVEDLLEVLEDAGLLDEDEAEAIEDCAEDARIPSLADDDDDDDGDDDDDDGDDD